MVDTSAVTAAKEALRSAARRIRAEISRQQGRAAAEQLAAHGIGFAGLPAAATVSGYLPIGEEIDPLPLLLRLARDGHGLALPVIEGKGAPLGFRRWRPGEPLVERSWGIREPLPSAPEAEPEVMLVPLLAFDPAGYRLGYGGGFYDRTLGVEQTRTRIVAIGLAYDAQEVPAVPRLDFDQRLDWVLTPTGPRRCVRE